MTQAIQNGAELSPGLARTPGQYLVERLARYDFEPEDLQAFADYIDRASDLELDRLNPRRAAAAAEIDLRRAIEIAALSVREGIFDLLWEVRCQHCTAPITPGFGNLKATPKGPLVCTICQGVTTPDADHSLRVVFSLNPAIRKLAIPAITLPDLERDPALTKEAYLQMLSPDLQAYIMSVLRLEAEHAPVTSLDLMHIQLFRDFFKDQLLPVHLSLKVTRVALVFTDLRGSTAMYAAKGDPQAYDLVRQHFELLAQATSRYGGVIIKTIGDAVMASFQRDGDAAHAAVAFQQAIAEFNRQYQLAPADALILKVGIHSGPCLSVTMNDLLDYFGTTVNMAARIAALSKGGDIVMSAPTLADPQVQSALRAGGYRLHNTVSVTLRGLSETTEVSQFVPASPPVLGEPATPRQLPA